MSVYLPSYLSCLVSLSSPVINYHTSRMFIHSCIHDIYTTSFLHGCISHPKSCLAVSLQFGPHSSSCQVASSNKWTSCILPFHHMPSCKFQPTNNLHLPFYLMTSGKFSIWTTCKYMFNFLKKCHPKCVWSRGVTKSFVFIKLSFQSNTIVDNHFPSKTTFTP